MTWHRILLLVAWFVLIIALFLLFAFTLAKLLTETNLAARRDDAPFLQTEDSTMAVNYIASVKTTRMQAVLTAIDNNASPATLEICGAGYTPVLAIITLGKPSFSLSGSQLTMLGVPRSDTSADNSGTAALARIKDGGGTMQLDGLTVAAPSGGDINLNSVAITAGQTITITAGTITHA